MESSILTSTKKILNLAPDYTVFDSQIIAYINSAFSTLNQMDLDATEGFSITGYSETWVNYTSESSKINAIKNFVFLKVRLLFDPPQSSFHIQMLETQLSQVEWRLSILENPA